MNELTIFLPSLRGGGAERQMVLLANGFAARGIAVTIVVAKAEGPNRSMIADGIPVYDLGTNRMVLALPQLISYLRSSRPGVVCSALFTANLLVILSRMWLRLPMRIVISQRSTMSVEFAHGGLIKRSLFPVLARWLYPKADAITTVSDGVARDLAEYVHIPFHRVRCVYNPVYSENIERLACVNVDHPWFGTEDVDVIISVGRLHTAKAFDVLIQAFARVRRSKPVKLVILGEGPERGALEGLVAALGITEDVQMPGFVANPWKYIKNASVFVLSSQWEGLPGALIEAMVCGTPVVATECPHGPAEVLENGKWGRLVAVGDIESLGEAILETLEDGHHPDVLTRSKSFSLDAAVDAYHRILFLKEIT